MEGDAESTPTTKVGQRKVTNQESGYATQRTDKQPAGMSADMSADEYGGARPKVKHAAEGKPKSFELFALDDIVSGNIFWIAFAKQFNRHSPNGTSPVIKRATYDGTSS